MNQLNPSNWPLLFQIYCAIGSIFALAMNLKNFAILLRQPHKALEFVLFALFGSLWWIFFWPIQLILDLCAE